MFKIVDSNPVSWNMHSRKLITPNHRFIGLRPASEILEWDVFNWSKAINFWQSHASQKFKNARVLEVGARNGGLTHWIMDLGASDVVVTDLNGPTAKAEHEHRNYIVESKVKHMPADVTDLDFSEEFDIIIFKSLLGSLGANSNLRRQNSAIESILKSLKPGGVMLWAENLASSPLHKWARKNFVTWGTKWCYMSLAELQDPMSPFERTDFSTAGLLGTFGRSEAQRRTFGRVDSIVAERIVPPSWNYIAFGISVKANSQKHEMKPNETANGDVQ